MSQEKTKVWVAIGFFILSAIIPIFLLSLLLIDAIGFVDISTSNWWLFAGAGLGFLLPFGLGSMVLVSIPERSNRVNLLPFFFSMFYSLIPEPLLVSLDDAAVMSVGALVSTWLAIRNNPRTPKWIVIPLLGAAAYSVIGGFLPGPVDELIVDLTAVVVSVYGMNTGKSKE